MGKHIFLPIKQIEHPRYDGRTALSQLKSAEERLERQADEAVVKEMNLQRACVQHQHEMRKKEREFARTRDTLQRVMGEQYKNTKVEFTLMNPIKPSSLPNESKTTMVSFIFFACSYRMSMTDQIQGGDHVPAQHQTV